MRFSLRTIFLVSVMILSISPVTLFTIYTVDWFKQALNQELSQRLQTQGREIQGVWTDLETRLTRESSQQVVDNNLIFDMISSRIEQMRDRVRNWLGTSAARSIKIYNRDGQLLLALEKENNNQIDSLKNLENGEVFLSPTFLESARRQNVLKMIDFGENLDLVIISQIKSTGGHLLGFMEKVVRVDGPMVNQIRTRFDVEVVFIDASLRKMISSMDLNKENQREIRNQVDSESMELFHLDMDKNAYGYARFPLEWNKQKVEMFIGTKTKASDSIVEKVNATFGTILVVIVLILILLSFAVSRIVFRPVTELLNAIRVLQQTGSYEGELRDNKTDLGLLAQSFNEMARTIRDTQNQLKKNLNELEKAYDELKATQTQLVQSAKMASLGQLVAGVAHELNNPIGFIHSNVAHLREYSEQLLQIIDDVESEKTTLKAAKKAHDYDYVKKDLPELLKACAEGAQRTRDIVLGLRNFSRLDEAELKEADIHEGIENTLRLLSGELKTRVKVEKRFGNIPKILCYPSQLNQVFMNILTNAAQAIEGNGKITIETSLKKNEIEIVISDSGAGMDKETLEKVFDPFFTTKSASKGTGLGLSITYGIVQKHGGRISATSERGSGTTFTILLPLKVST